MRARRSVAGTSARRGAARQRLARCLKAAGHSRCGHDSVHRESGDHDPWARSAASSLTPSELRFSSAGCLPRRRDVGQARNRMSHRRRHAARSAEMGAKSPKTASEQAVSGPAAVQNRRSGCRPAGRTPRKKTVGRGTCEYFRGALAVVPMIMGSEPAAIGRNPWLNRKDGTSAAPDNAPSRPLGAGAQFRSFAGPFTG